MARPRSSAVCRLVVLPDMISLARRSAVATLIGLLATSSLVVYRFCQGHHLKRLSQDSTSRICGQHHATNGNVACGNRGALDKSQMLQSCEGVDSPHSGSIPRSCSAWTGSEATCSCDARAILQSYHVLISLGMILLLA